MPFTTFPPLNERAEVTTKKSRITRLPIQRVFRGLTENELKRELAVNKLK